MMQPTRSTILAGLLGVCLAHAMPVWAAQAEAPPRLDVFGDSLPDGAVARVGTTRLRHGGAITALTFSPDSRLLASGGADNVVRLWDLATGKQHWGGAGDDVSALDFAPDGKSLASVSRYGAIRLWNVKSGRPVHQLPGHVSAGATSTSAIRFSPDGNHLSLVDNDGNVLYREVDAVGMPASFRVERDHWFRMGLSADGKLATSAGRDHVVRLWDVATGKQVLTLPAHKDYPYGAVFSLDGRYLASGGRSNQIHLWELATGQLIYTLPCTDYVFVFSPDGRTLVSCGGASEVRLWDVPSGKERRVIRHDNRWIEQLAFSPDGRWLATGGRGGVVRLWNPATGQEKLALSDLEGAVPLAYLPGGRTLAVQSTHGVHFLTISAKAQPRDVWSVKEDRLVRVPSVAALAPDGKTAVAGQSYRSYFVWNLEQGAERHRIDDRGEISSVAFAPDSKMVAIASHNSVVLWDAVAAKTLHKLEGHKSRSTGLAFAPDGKTLLSAGGQGGLLLRFWDTATGTEIRQHSIPGDRDHDDYPATLRFSPSGRVLAIGARHRALQLWDVAEKKLLLQLAAFSGPFAFSPDGALLATSGKHHEVQLWEMATGKPFWELQGHEGPVNSLLFAPDGKSLISGSADNTLLVWDVRPQRFGKPAGKLDAATLIRCWNDLRGGDPIAAGQALAELAADPGTSLGVLKDRLQPIKPAPAEQLRALIANLDAKDFATRDKAHEELTEFGRLGADAMREALGKNPSLETRRGLEQLLAAIPHSEILVPSGEGLACLRSIRLLEDIASPAAEALLQDLAGGAASALETQAARAALERRHTVGR